jgi:hypothetical protein
VHGVVEHGARQAVDLHDQQPPPAELRPRSSPEEPDGSVEGALCAQDKIV